MGILLPTVPEAVETGGRECSVLFHNVGSGTVLY